LVLLRGTHFDFLNSPSYLRLPNLLAEWRCRHGTQKLSPQARRHPQRQVAGYSRLMQDDEAVTVATLESYKQVFSI